ncbi:Glutamyl aminopeptidase [Trichoplax sp. H2]|nr:Glutamyl aminopeptidase [Trichoplax sp. H2]|eukprot:RDD38414.1 Glutamyl aminopeptidase [Trichoplax sp. H2]
MFSAEKSFLIDESDIIFNINRNKPWYKKHTKGLLIALVAIVILGIGGILMGVFIPRALQNMSHSNSTTLPTRPTTPSLANSTQQGTTMSLATHATSKATSSPNQTTASSSAHVTTATKPTSATGSTPTSAKLPTSSRVTTSTRLPPTTASTPTKTATPSVQLPTAQATTPKTQATTPKTQATTPKTQATTPMTQATTPKTQATTPKTQATTPMTQATTPKTQATTPMTKATTPMTQATTPMTQATTPKTQATTPMTQATTPKTQATTPATKLPTAKPSTPSSPAANTSTPSSTPISIPFPELASSRLRTSIKPENYKLMLQLHPERNLIVGEVQITVMITQPTDIIIVHAKNITITDTPKIGHYHSGPVPVIEKVGYYAANDYYYIKLQRMQAIGKYFLFYNFASSIQNAPQGIYTQSYFSSDQESNSPSSNLRKIFLSNSYPNNARLIFPCFDEPSFLAKFQLTMFRNATTTSATLFNGRLFDSKVLKDGLVQDRFNESTLISPHNLAIAVLDFEPTLVPVQTNMSNIYIRLWTPPDQSMDGKSTLDTAALMASLYQQEYFKLDYPFMTLDMVAIPNFYRHLQAHTNILFYKADALLYDPLSTPDAELAWKRMLLGSGISYQWLGGSFSMAWWDQYWLQEAMKSHARYYGLTSGWQPAMGINDLIDDLKILEMQSALAMDSSAYTAPLQGQDTTADSWSANNFYLIREKGYALLRTLQAYDNSINIDELIQKFAKNSRNLVTSVSEFWKLLPPEVTTKFDFNQLIQPWLTQPGYPYVNVSSTQSNQSELLLSQSQYIDIYRSNIIGDSVPMSGYSWYVPFTWNSFLAMNFSSKNNLIVLNPDLGNMNSTPIDIGNSILLNANVKLFGFYRVLYPAATWNNYTALIPKLPSNTIAMLSTGLSKLMDDAFAFAKLGRLSYVQTLTMSKSITQQHALFLPWATYKQNMNFIANIVKYFIIDQALYQDYHSRLVKNIMNELTFKNVGDYNKRLTRVVAMDYYCLEDKQCRNYTKEQFLSSLYSDSNTTIPANLKSIIFKYGIADTDEAAWEKVLDMFKSSTVPSDRLLYLEALTYSKNVTLWRRYLDMTLNRTLMSSLEALKAFDFMASRGLLNLQLAWPFVTNNLEALYQRFNFKVTFMEQLLNVTAARYVDKDNLQRVQNFFHRDVAKIIPPSVKDDIIATISSRINWVSLYRETVKNFFAANP